MTPLLIGSLGVAILLLAFVLNLARRLTERSPIYLLLNFIGAGMAGWYAWQGGILPFVILEGVWCGTALVRLIAAIQESPR